MRSADEKENSFSFTLLLPVDVSGLIGVRHRGQPLNAESDS